MHRIFMRLQISKQELAERKSKSEIKSIRKEQQIKSIVKRKNWDWIQGSYYPVVQHDNTV